jgi:hypothetical protein
VNSKLIEETVPYSGVELRSGWVRERFGLEGDAIVAFHGPCSVAGEALVDLEDLEAGETVEGENMLHFIAEISGIGLPGIAFLQRLLCIIAGHAVEEARGRARKAKPGDRDSCQVRRDGDDLYVGDGKLSVSIATVSPESGLPERGLIHLGLNISTAGVPVKAACLEGLGVDYRELAPSILTAFSREVEGGLHASRKVRRVP